MLIDAVLLPLKKMADEGDPDAQIEMLDIFFEGRGAAVDYSLSKKYMIMLSHHDPSDLPQIGYGSLLYLIGNVCGRMEQWAEAKQWYQKSVEYFHDTYIEEFANKLINEFNLESLIEKTEQKIASQ